MQQKNNKLYKTGLILLFTGFLLLNLKTVNAVVVENLYESEIPVSDQTRPTRHQVFSQAFQQTIIRVVGSSSVLGNAAIDEARRNVLKYISQFRYRELPEALRLQQEAKSQSGAVVDPDYKPFTNILWVKFDTRAINRLLSDNQLAVWGKQRPETLVWIAVRDGRHRYILREQDKSPIKDEIEKSARLRGIPVVWPGYDQTDQSRLSFLDIWGGFWDNILNVSRRYQRDSILVGRYLWTGSEWQVKWDLLTDRHLQYWQINSAELDLLSTVGIDQTADRVSKKYALLIKDNAEQGGNIFIDIHGIDSVESYAKTMQYLQSLQSIKDLNASEVNENGVRFVIEARGKVDDVKRMIELGRYLKPSNIQVSQQQPAATDIVLAYELP